MKPRPTIFLSGVSDEFPSFRDAVENEIEMKGCFAENQPGFPPDYRTVEEMLRRKLHDADAVIHIVGFRYGAEPNQRPASVPRRSYTQMEFDIARELQKPVFVFLSKAETVRDEPKPDEQPEDAETAARQLAHREAVQQTNHLYYFFQDKAELCKLAAEIPPVEAAGFQADISRIIKYAPEELIGRESELSVLSVAWDKVRRAETPRPHVITFVALGGEGKTSLVAKSAAELAHAEWPGCEAAFAWSFYSQGTREQVAASSDLFLKEALTLFGDEALANSAQGAYDKGRRLAQLVGQRRALLILDGLEPLQYAPSSPTPGELKDQGIAALLKGLAASNRGLCVVTTRYSIADLRAYWQTTAPEIELRRLSTEAGVSLLKKLGVKTGSRADFERLVEDVDGHALTLQILGGFLARAFQGDIRRRDRVRFEKADAKIQGGHAFRAMGAYVKWLENESEEARREVAILQLLGLFDRPATGDCIAALVAPPAIPGLTEPLVALAEEDWEFSLTALEAAKLITVHRDDSSVRNSSFVIRNSIDAHPLLREYFAQKLCAPTGRNMPAQGNALGPQTINNADSPEGATQGANVLPFQGSGVSDASVPGALPQADLSRPVGAEVALETSDAWRSAHRRLYEHLCATTKEGDQPTLEDLQPLYQAVAHGCKAGMPQEAFDDIYLSRIMRNAEQYSTKKLGAIGSELGLMASFFEIPWSRISPALTEACQAWLLNAAAFRLNCLSRLTEALELRRAVTEMTIRLGDWRNAAVDARNLSELDLTLGDLVGAVGDAEHSVTYADRSGDPYIRIIVRTTYADALHQAGRWAEAFARFRESETIQAEIQRDFPLLYSLRGFQFCDLLLALVERAAWQLRLNHKSEILKLELIDVCHVVAYRAEQTFKWAAQFRFDIISAALDNLTLGRTAFYEQILKGTSLDLCREFLDQAVSGLRRAGDATYLPRGLLTRAWLRFLTGARTGPESAQSDLDEAWEIAERGPMPLFIADIHLYRARLFGITNCELRITKEEGEYPWQSPQHDLAEARRLIMKHGYLRRKEELEDAEAALNRSQALPQK